MTNIIFDWYEVDDFIDDVDVDFVFDDDDDNDDVEDEFVVNANGANHI